MGSSEKDLECKYRELKKLVDITKIINATLDIGKLLSAVMASIKDILHTEASSLLFFDEESDELIFKAVVGESSEILTEQYRFKTFEGIAGWCAAHKKSIIVNDVYNDNRFNPKFDKITGFKTNSIICAPLMFKGKLIGVVEGINPIDRSQFTNDDLALFNLFAEHAVMAVQNAIIFERSIERNKMQHDITAAQNLFVEFLKPVTITQDALTTTIATRSASEFCGDVFTSRQERDHTALFLADTSLISLPGAITGSYIAGKITAFGRLCENSAQVVRCFFSSQKDIAISLKTSMLYGKLFTKEALFEYTLLGTIEILHFSAKGIKILRANSDQKNGIIKRSQLTLEKGDVLLIFTAGIQRLKNRKGEPFGIQRIAKQVDCNESPETIISKILNCANNYNDNLKTFEDITIACIKHK